MEIVHYLHILYYTYVIADIKVKFLHSVDIPLGFDEVSERASDCNQKLKEEGICPSSFPRLVTKLKRGGIFRGTLWFNVHSWKICADTLNALPPDAVVLGYYEFIEGMDGLKNYVNSLRASVLASNLDFSGIAELEDKIKPYIILGKKGVKIGATGYTSQATTLLVGQVKPIKKYAVPLNNHDAKIIIALGNSGVKKDNFVAFNASDVTVVVGEMDRLLFRNRPALSIEHPLQAYPEIVIDSSSRTVPILHAYDGSKYLGCLNLTFDKNGGFLSRRGDPLLREYSAEPDQGLAKPLDRFRKDAEEKEGDECGETKVMLEGTNDICGQRECNLGNLIADAYVEYDVVRNSGPFWTNTPIGLVYAAVMTKTIVATMNKGKICRKDLQDALPFDFHVVRFSVTGSVLKSAFETAVRHDFASRTGEFLQVSGIQVQYDLKQKSGKRVVSLKARCGECEVPQFETVKGSVVYNIVGPNKLINEESFFIDMRDKHFNAKVYPEDEIEIIEEYIKRHSPISTGERDGILILSEESRRSRGHTAHLGHNNILNNVIMILIYIF